MDGWIEIICAQYILSQRQIESSRILAVVRKNEVVLLLYLAIAIFDSWRKENRKMVDSLSITSNEDRLNYPSVYRYIWQSPSLTTGQEQHTAF
jgi:hypothetical protein